MGERIFVLVICILTSALTLSGQCIDKDSLWKRLMFLWHSPPGSPAEQLKELLKYEGDIKNCSYRNDSTHAFLLFRIGATYNRQADYLRGAQYARQSINMIAANVDKPSMNLKHVIKYYYFLSVMYDSLYLVTEKMKALDSCIAVATRLNAIDLFCIDALHQRTEYFYDMGDYHRCFSYATNCEKLAMEYAGSSVKDSIAATGYATNCFQWKVNVLLQLKSNELAETLLTGKVDEYKKAGTEIYLGTLYHQLAKVQVNKGNYAKAVLYYERALNYAKKFRFDINCKAILSDLGYNIYFKQYNDWDQALITYRKALTFISKDRSRNRENAVESLNEMGNIANVYVKKGLYDSAFHYFQLAFDQVKPGANETVILYSSLDDFFKTKRIYYVIDLLVDKGDAYQQQYGSTGQLSFLHQAIRIYKTTDRLLDRIKSEQSALQSKLFWRSDTRRLYEHAIEACYADKNVNDAFYFFERSRATLLNDQLNEQRWLGEKDILKQVQVKRKILQKERELKSLDALSQNYATVQHELFSSQQELDRLINIIKASNPIYYQSFLDTGFTSLQDVQKQVLLNHQALVEIFAGDSVIYSLVITAHKAKLTKINKSAFDSVANLYISYISNADLMNKSFDAFINTSGRLYQLIFQDNPTPRGRIIISPDGRYFPFEALVTNTQPLTYFLNDHAVSYTYSAGYLMNQFASPTSNTSHNFIGFAPVHYPAAMDLSALPGSANSLHKLQSYFSGADNFIAGEASRNKFIQKFYQYKIIQLYTHATDSSNTGEPAIFFADSALYLSDLIPEKKPVTRLIVLSACETGTGKVYQGEGVFSFNRGFAALGIPAAITNLWSVDNESTYRLTELFYKYLSTGMSADLALQKAKLEFIQTASKGNRLPNYWAATILAGKTNAIELKKTFSGEILVLIIGFTGLSGWIFWWRRSRKKELRIS